MRAQRGFVMLIGVILWVVSTNPPVTAQSRNLLPAPLVFTTSQNERDEQPVSLVYVDPATLTFRTLYTDDRVVGVHGLRALSWSPAGTELAILRIEEANTVPPSSNPPQSLQICILSREGTLKLCAADAPYDAGISVPQNQYDFVSWSADGQQLYFVIREGEHIHLIEVDATTGQRVRNLYSLSLRDLREPPLLNWTPDVEYVVVGTGNLERTHVPFLMHIPTGQRILLTADDIDVVGTKRFCQGFSPRGTYVTALNRNDGFSIGLEVIDTQGTVVHRLGTQNALGIRSFGCPVWASDESAFYFSGQLPSSTDYATGAYFRYRLSDRHLEAYQAWPEFLPQRQGQYFDIYIWPGDGTILSLTRSGRLTGPVYVSGHGHRRELHFPVPFISFPLWSPVLP